MQESQFVLDLQREAKRQATLEAKQEALQIFLAGRFGTMPADQVGRIKATTDLAKLDQLIRAACHITRLEDLPL